MVQYTSLDSVDRVNCWNMELWVWHMRGIMISAVAERGNNNETIIGECQMNDKIILNLIHRNRQKC